MTQIGFLSESRRKEQPPVKKDWLVKFDSGHSIGVQDALRHIGIFGSTGTGKTESFIYPLIHRHL